MKTHKNLSVLLACLAGVCFFNPQTTAATLIGSAATVPAAVNLTQEGTLDWAAWGLNVATDFDQKEGGTNQISNATLIGPAPDGPYQYGNALAAFSWTDGSPDPTAAATTTGIYFNGQSNGYQITVPADTTPKILRIYAGGWNSTVHFDASLSDQSASGYTNESLVTPANTAVADVYTVEYAAGSAGQTLTLNVYNLTGNGNCTLMAASLAGSTPEIVSPPASQTAYLGYSAYFTVQAEGWSPLAYRWWAASNGVYVPLADGGQISGSKTPALTINDLVSANATNYIVTVTNLYGAATSAAAALAIAPITGTLNGSAAPAPPTANLDVEGTLDWAHWGLNVATDFDDKAGGGNKIGNVTLFGPSQNGPFQYGNALVAFSWTNGAPDTTASATATGIYVNNLGDGYQFTVPADTTKRILRVYAGGWNSAVHFQAALSDETAPPYVDESLVTAGANQAANVYTVEYAAASAGQTLTVTVYNIASGGNCTLMAASLSGPSPTIVDPPVSETGYLGYSSTFTVSAEGWSPLVYQWWQESNGVYAPLTDGVQVSGSTNSTLTINSLGAANATNYIVTVTNLYGAATSPVASLSAASITGALSGSAVVAPATVDLTAEGTLDWAHWGLNVATDFDDKAGGSNQISNLTLIGPSQNGPFQYGGAAVAFSWTDGSPDAIAADSATGVYFNNFDDGYQFTVPADKTRRILRVYAGGYNTTVHFEASLSDQSAPPYIDESLVTAANGSLSDAYTIAYAAASAGQTLTITVYDITGNGNCALMAATLTGPEPRITGQPVSGTNWVGQNQQFSVSSLGWAPLVYQWWRQENGVYAPLTDGPQISGSTTATLNLGNLTFADATNYYVVLTNAYGAVTSSVAVLTILPVTATLFGSALPAPTLVDLTAAGTLDWAAWGLNGATDFEQKAGGTNQISNLTTVGPTANGPNGYGGALVGFSWSDGGATPSVTNEANGVYFNDLNNGYQISVPADSTMKTLTLYAGGWSCQVQVEAALSDLGAPTYIAPILTASTDSAADAYTIDFADGSPGQTLIVTVTCATGGGNCTLMAATLSITPPSPPTLLVGRAGSILQLTWPSGGTLLQSTNITGPWTAIPGAMSPFTNTPSASRMFYRVQVQ